MRYENLRKAVRAEYEKRGLTKIVKGLKRELKKIDTIETAEKPDSFVIWVDWKKSRTWGANPHTELIVNGDTYRGKATGCGYDKESAAIAEVLNLCPGTLKILYETKNAALAGDENISNEKAIWWGAGYGALPYYERGVGVASIVTILEKCGYVVKYHYSPERSFLEVEKRRG